MALISCSWRLRADIVDLLKRLADKKKISKAAVITTALLLLAKKEGVSVE